MASQTSDSSYLSAQDVCNGFLHQYYHCLYRSPDQVHKFYQDESEISRPGPDKVMTSVKTMKGINEKIMSFDYKDYKMEIITADTQESLMGGLIIAVTGCFVRKDNAKRKFTQMFFLAKQDKHYFVLNDIFRFVDVPKPSAPLAVHDVDENVPAAPLAKNSEPTHVPNHTSTPKNAVSDNGITTSNPSDNVKDSDVRKIDVPKSSANPTQNDVLPVSNLASNNREDAPKVSYASMVARASKVTSPVPASSCVIVRVAPNADQQLPASGAHKASAASQTHKISAPQPNGAPQSSIALAKVKSLYIGNLPKDITKNELIAVFKKFGTIKQHGVQLRKYDQDGFSFAFVQFASPDSARMAVEAHNITFGGRRAFIDYRRSSTQGDKNRENFAYETNEFRNENSRGRANFSESRSNGRCENGNRGDFSGKTQGSFGRNGEAHQRVYQNGDGRQSHQGAKK